MYSAFGSKLMYGVAKGCKREIRTFSNCYISKTLNNKTVTHTVHSFINFLKYDYIEMLWKSIFDFSFYSI